MRILVTGAGGQVGQALAAEFETVGDLCLATRQDLDLSYPPALAERLNGIEPDLIINAAAYTAVDKAETEREAAFTVNALAVKALGEWSARRNAPIVHFSTDYVFDGRASEPYIETHPLNPLSVYGESKAEGEKLLLGTGAPCLIVRTSWVYSATGKNFLKTIARLASEREELAVVYDQIGAPTSSAQIARFIRRLIGEDAAPLPELFEKASHVVHLTASGRTSWHGFACAIVEGMRHRGVPVKASRIRAISSSEYPTPAVRPRSSCLSAERLERVFGFRCERWEHVLNGVLDTLYGENSPQ
jgi:dTDP-4-dehydrorhamnose reductase